MNPKKAIVLLNMGGPNNLDEVQVFLMNMFSDPYILPIKNNFLRKLLARFITNRRLKEAQENYKHLGGYSPLVKHTANLCKKLQTLNKDYFYTYVMRYTPPFATPIIQELKAKNIQELILFSMYPHFSYTTIQSSYDDFMQAAKEQNYHPTIKSIMHYHQNTDYNQAAIQKIKEALQNDDSKQFNLILSAHSLPQKNIDKGDPYQKEVEENAHLLVNMLKEQGIEFQSTRVAYQSKIGPIKWLDPNLQDILPQYKDKKLLIYPIAFTIDNSETDFELSIQYKQEAKAIGIKDYRVASCLNDSPHFAQSILSLCKEAS